MSQSMTFWSDCWVYTKKSERDSMREVIRVLKQCKTATLTNISSSVKDSCKHSVRTALLYLLIIKAVNVKERSVRGSFKSARIFSLMPGYAERLAKAFSFQYNKRENKSKTLIKRRTQ